MAVAACPDQRRRNSRWRSAAKVRRRSILSRGLQDRRVPSCGAVSCPGAPGAAISGCDARHGGPTSGRRLV